MSANTGVPLAVPELGRLAGGNGNQQYGSVKGEITKSLKSLPPLKAGNSALLTAGIIIADIVGAGILSMGTAIAKFGWLIGLVVIAVMIALNVHICWIMWRLRMGNPNVYTYLDMVSAGFAQAPSWQRQFMEPLSLGVQQVQIFLVLGVYTLSVGRSLGTLFYSELHLCLPVLVMLGLAVFLPVHLSSRTMGKYGTLIGLNVLTIMGSVLIPLIHMAIQGVESTRPAGSTMVAIAEPSLSGIFSGLEVMAFAFTSQLMIIEIIAEMREPAEFPKAYLISTPFQGIMFVAAGVGTYYFMGSSVVGILGENLPFGPTFRTSSACLFLHMLIAYLIKGVVFCRWAHSVWSPSSLNEDGWRGWCIWSLIVGASTVSCWLVSQLVPFFTELIDLLGATLTPVNTFLIPIAAYLRWLYDTKWEVHTVGPSEAAVMVFEVLLSVLLMTYGTYNSASVIAARWREFGMPFDCHCQGIWATCACSATHPGMEYCVANL